MPTHRSDAERRRRRAFARAITEIARERGYSDVAFCRLSGLPINDLAAIRARGRWFPAHKWHALLSNPLCADVSSMELLDMQRSIGKVDEQFFVALLLRHLRRYGYEDYRRILQVVIDAEIDGQDPPPLRQYRSRGKSAAPSEDPGDPTATS